MTHLRIAYCFLGIAALGLLFACSNPSSFSPEQRGVLHLMADRTIVCEQGPDCDAKWARALAWVTNHTETGIRTASDHLISTNMESGGTGLRESEFIVVRYENDEGGDTFNFTSFCDRNPAFNCAARGLKFRADFINAVIGLPAGVKKTGPEAYRLDRRLITLAQP